MLANANAYTADTLDGTGHLRVTVAPSCVIVDFIRAYLPADTVSGLHHNQEVAFSYTIGNCITGISSINKDDELKIYPNPANKSIAVRIPEDMKNYEINFLSMLGQTLLQTKSNVIDVNDIPNGIYFVTVQSDKTILNKKLIINH
jgi:hypothetical protein